MKVTLKTFIANMLNKLT